jgi:hypothetical protein
MMEIAAIVPMMPPAMAPAFELCPPGPTGIDVPVFEDLEVEAETDSETDELDTVTPSTAPGPSSGETMKVRCGHETVTEGLKGREFSPPVAYDLVEFQKFSFWNGI